jgi:hypothetical protein
MNPLRGHRSALAGVAGTLVLLAGCADAPTIPSAAEFTALDRDASLVAAACETITFDEFTHGAAVPGVSLLGLNLAVQSLPYVQPGGAANPNTSARAFDTNTDVNPAAVEDDDLQWKPGGECTDCEGLGRVLVIDDERNSAPGFFFWGDYRWGGVLRIGGFAGGSYYVESFTYADNNVAGPTDIANEPAATMRVDGATDVGSTTPGPDGNVQVIATSHAPFTSMIELRMGTAAADLVTGSGGLDDVRICRIATGFGVRTPGYWKNDKKTWPVSSITIGGVVYTRAEADDLMEHPTAGDKTYNMFEQLVAAKLNVLSGAAAGCIMDTIDDADAWMADFPPGSGVSASSAAWQTAQPGLAASASAMHSELDDYNNGLLCAPGGG